MHHELRTESLVRVAKDIALEQSFALERPNIGVGSLQDRRRKLLPRLRFRRIIRRGDPDKQRRSFITGMGSAKIGQPVTSFIGLQHITTAPGSIEQRDAASGITLVPCAFVSGRQDRSERLPVKHVVTYCKLGGIAESFVSESFSSWTYTRYHLSP